MIRAPEMPGPVRNETEITSKRQGPGPYIPSKHPYREGPQSPPGRGMPPGTGIARYPPSRSRARVCQTPVLAASLRLFGSAGVRTHFSNGYKGDVLPTRDRHTLPPQSLTHSLFFSPSIICFVSFPFLTTFLFSHLRPARVLVKGVFESTSNQANLVHPPSYTTFSFTLSLLSSPSYSPSLYCAFLVRPCFFNPAWTAIRDSIFLIFFLFGGISVPF